ncbi:nucleotide pyrophosphohydrolase [Paenibacillus sp. SSG-1]|uniref:nucleotide pyrophosphohydrolase n=1 Tax=Paenibacillus sp. SSG-1 TaxID=1443669 RepID=UPI000B7ED354|nr:nucleotide pyrophosphohydrolase [Paenibacillus sp. SSG-1]OXL85843.1 nucleotide pyrophosphohydrolase [Paenibacillus sp. SSG-1]
MDELTTKILKFRDQRNWGQFHNAKDLAISLSLEASELLELFQWKRSEDVIKDKIEDIKDELSDVLYYVLLMSHDLGINIEEALESKLEKNEKKYPVDKAYGSNKKYSEL